MKRQFFLFTLIRYVNYFLLFLLLKMYGSYLLAKLNAFVGFYALFGAYLNNYHIRASKNMRLINIHGLQNYYVQDNICLVFGNPLYLFFYFLFLLYIYICICVFFYLFIFLLYM